MQLLRHSISVTTVTLSSLKVKSPYAQGHGDCAGNGSQDEPATKTGFLCCVPRVYRMMGGIQYWTVTKTGYQCCLSASESLRSCTLPLDTSIPARLTKSAYRARNAWYGSHDFINRNGSPRDLLLGRTSSLEHQ